MLPALLALALSAAAGPSSAPRLVPLPALHPALAGGERWVYEVNAPGGLRTKGRLELTVLDEGRRQRARVRHPGVSLAEIVAPARKIPQALMLSPDALAPPARARAELERQEDEPLAALSWLVRASPGHLDWSCLSRWSGEPFARGSRCGDAVVVGPCDVGSRAGVWIEAPVKRPAGTLTACVDPSRGLPLSVTLREGDRIRLEARLAEHGAARAEPGGPLPDGVWDLGKGVPGRSGRVVELRAGAAHEGALVAFSPERGWQLCPLGPARAERLGGHLALYAARPRRLGGAIVHVAEELRVVGGGRSARLVADEGGRDRVIEPLERVERAPRGCSVPVTSLLSEQRLEAERERGQTPLQSAVERDDLDAVRRLLDAGAAIDAVSPAPGEPHWQLRGRTPLQLASASGYDDIARLLLERGADPNAGLLRPSGAPRQASDVYWSPPLAAWLLEGDLDLVRLLLARGARWDVGSRAIPHALAVAVRDDRLYAALLGAGAPAGYREVVDAVDRKDLGALRAGLANGRWAEDAVRLARGAEWREGVQAAATPSPGAGQPAPKGTMR